MQMRKTILALKYLALYYVSLTLILFAFSKFFGAQFEVSNFAGYTPLKDLTNRQLAWAFFGYSYHYNLFLGIIEFIAGVLILFKRARLVGLLLALGIYSNIVLIDIEFGINDAVQHATIEFIIILIWLLQYLKDLKKYFWDMSGKFASNESENKKLFSVYLPFVFIICITVYSLYRFRHRFNPPNKAKGAYEVLGLSVNGEPIELGHGQYTKPPMLFLDPRNIFVLSLSDSSYFGNYNLNNDSLFLSFDKEFRNIKSLKATIENDIITGLSNKGQLLEIQVGRTRKEN